MQDLPSATPERGPPLLSVRNPSMLSLGLLLAAFLTLATPISSPPDTDPGTGSEIDLSEFVPSFREEFDELDLTEWGCLSRWTAHTPWDGDFGDARFTGPQDGFPFVIHDGILTIEARRDSEDNWRSGMLSSWNRCNGGFAQQYGYFEMRARMPEGAGFWPAFWLIGVDRSEGTSEIDIVEYYSHRPHKISLAIHKHRLTEKQRHVTRGKRHEVPPGSLSREFHTYGAEVTEKEIIFYFERREIWRTEAPEQFRQPMYILVSLAAEKYRMDGNTPDSAKMEVDYVRAYQRKPLGL